MLRGLYIFSKRVFFAFTIPALVWGTFIVVMYYGSFLCGENARDAHKFLGLLCVVFGIIYLPSPIIYARVCQEHGIMGWDERIF